MDSAQISPEGAAPEPSALQAEQAKEAPAEQAEEAPPGPATPAAASPVAEPPPLGAPEPLSPHSQQPLDGQRSPANGSDEGRGPTLSRCKHWVEGRCRWGAACKYAHPTSIPGDRTKVPGLRPTAPVKIKGKWCNRIWKNSCTFDKGTTCEFWHIGEFARLCPASERDKMKMPPLLRRDSMWMRTSAVDAAARLVQQCGDSMWDDLHECFGGIPDIAKICDTGSFGSDAEIFAMEIQMLAAKLSESVAVDHIRCTENIARCIVALECILGDYLQPPAHVTRSKQSKLERLARQTTAEAGSSGGISRITMNTLQTSAAAASIAAKLRDHRRARVEPAGATPRPPHQANVVPPNLALSTPTAALGLLEGRICMQFICGGCEQGNQCPLLHLGYYSHKRQDCERPFRLCRPTHGRAEALREAEFALLKWKERNAPKG
eukprot:TRINITY_DN22576_c0_g1_i1.p1 TRINITY_DN22576_c0_g1~~TRINITY_DN22576_c0_g1_i1.p1  ORF type:complete len:493 (+),score=109.60 TRINITY_DN22576_c0_g1_i1:178-1479(+)